jgi:hypothetical protein
MTPNGIASDRMGTSCCDGRFHRMTDPKTKRDHDKSKPDEEVSPAGPHDKPALTDHHKTPGSGMLPDKDIDEVEGPSG